VIIEEMANSKHDDESRTRKNCPLVMLVLFVVVFFVYPVASSVGLV
jgi:hypothetical protein